MAAQKCGKSSSANGVPSRRPRTIAPAVEARARPQRGPISHAANGRQTSGAAVYWAEQAAPGSSPQASNAQPLFGFRACAAASQAPAAKNSIIDSGLAACADSINTGDAQSPAAANKSARSPKSNRPARKTKTNVPSENAADHSRAMR